MNHVITAVIVLLFIWMFSMMGAIFNAEQTCLERGYPKSEVTWKYQTYCLTMEGAVTPKVVRP